MKDDINYSPSDCFETFPFPEAWETRTEPGGRGCKLSYHDFRANLMTQNAEGLTKTYSRFHDPHENALRDCRPSAALHADMDRAGPGRLRLARHPDRLRVPARLRNRRGRAWGARKKPYRYRWPDKVRDEVLARLIELNAQRAAEEARSGKAATVCPAEAGTAVGVDLPSVRASATRAAEPRPLWGTSDD